MTRKTAIKLILAALVMPRIEAQEKSVPSSIATLNTLDTIRITQPKEYTISFAPTLEKLHIVVAGKTFTFTPEEIAAALS